MSNYKLIFTGPVGAGKTTAIGALSDIEPISTESQATDATRERKPKTTVAMDYGRVSLAGGEIIHLYGTPGQERFDFMWEILTEGGLGLILLIDNARPNPLEDCRFFVSAFREFIDRTAMAVGITRFDLCANPTVDDYVMTLQGMGLPDVPVFEVDARQRADVGLLVEAMICTLGVTGHGL